MPHKGKQIQPWTPKEHKRFQEALEKYGGGRTGEEWDRMSEFVGSRNTTEVQIHARKYFEKLQAMTVTDESPSLTYYPASGNDKEWTHQQDDQFETLLAVHFRKNECWDEIARHFPDKRKDEVFARFNKLVYDIHLIEQGEQVELSYRFPPK